MKGIKQTILLGTFFLILVATYTSFSFIVTYMNEHKQDGFKQLGPILLASNYIVFLITNSFAPSIRLTHKMQMKIAALCYTFNYITQALMLPGGWGIGITIFGTMVGGFGAAILWVSYGSYMKTLCKNNKQQHLQGRYFAISNAITFASILLGPIITTFCFQLFSDQVYFIVLSGFGILSFIYCSIFIKQIQNTQFSSVYHCMPELKKSLRYYKKMTAIIPALIFDGLVLGFVSTSSTNLMPKDSARVQIGQFLIILGAGCILGGFLAGYLSDVINSKNAGKLSIMIVLIVSVITVLLNPYMNKALAFLCAFLWGLARQFIEGWLYVACSINYNGRLQSYGNMKQLHSLAFCIYQAIAIITHLKIETSYFMLVFIVLSPICFYFLNNLPDPLYIKQEQQIRQDKTISLQSSSEQSN